MMSDHDSGQKVSIRLAKGPDDVAAAQRLRYKVFYEEFHAIADEQTAKSQMDIDEFDQVADHLIVFDENLPRNNQIVGTYRLLRREIAEQYGKFYTSGEFNIQPLLDAFPRVLELGRSCVLPEYRTRPTLQKLWQGIAQYIGEHKIDLMFGCGSLYGTSPEDLKHQLSYLYHYHLAAPDVCPRARDERYVKMDMVPKDQIDVKSVFMTLPPLIKGYIRVGATIGDGAVIDHQWNSTDVCIVMPTKLLAEKYMKHYTRDTNTLEQLEQDLAEQAAAIQDSASQSQKKAI